MYVGETTGVEEIQQPGRKGRTEILVERRHRARLDVTTKTRSHHVFLAAAETLYKRLEFTEVVRAICVAHQHVLAANERNCINVRSAQPSLRSPEYTRSLRQRNFRGCITGAVDNQDLTTYVAPPKTLQTPIDELRDGEFFVEGRNYD